MHVSSWANKYPLSIMRDDKLSSPGHCVSRWLSLLSCYKACFQTPVLCSLVLVSQRLNCLVITQDRRMLVSYPDGQTLNSNNISNVNNGHQRVWQLFSSCWYWAWLVLWSDICSLKRKQWVDLCQACQRNSVSREMTVLLEPYNITMCVRTAASLHLITFLR